MLTTSGLSPSYPARAHEARIWKRENVGALLESGFFVNDTDHFVEKALYDRGGEGAQEGVLLPSLTHRDEKRSQSDQKKREMESASQPMKGCTTIGWSPKELESRTSGHD